MADIQMSFPIFALLARGGIDNLPHIEAWKQKVDNSPGWKRTLEQGGPLSIPGED
jgi:glutathione S-transferase